MVEHEDELDAVFGSLSDPTRRDILKRISEGSMSVGTIANYYDFSLAGVAKHLEVLKRAGLVSKARKGKEQIVTIEPKALAVASGYLEFYRHLWDLRLDRLDMYLTSTHKEGK